MVTYSFNETIIELNLKEFLQEQKLHSERRTWAILCMGATRPYERYIVFIPFKLGGILLLRIFSVAISVSPHVFFILDLILISIFLR